MVQFLRYLLPPLFETIQLEYAISDTETGIMYSLLMLTYGFMQFPSGYLSDRFNERLVITVGGVTFAVASLFIALSAPFWSLVAAVALMGIGTGMHKTVAINLLSRIYPTNKGLSFGVMETVGQGGGVVAPMVIVIVFALAIPWRLTFALGFVLTLLLVIGFRRSIRRQERRDPTPKNESTDSTIGHSEGPDPGLAYLRLFRYYHFSAFVVVSTIFTFTWTGFAAFYPLYLTRIGELSTGTAGLLYSLLFLLTVSQMVTGGLSDRVDSVMLVLMLFGMMSIGLLALVVWPSFIPLVVITLVLGIGFFGFRPAREAYLMDIIPRTIGGGVLGLVRSIMTIIGAASPTIMGTISDSAGLTNSFVLLLITTVAGVGIIATMKLVPMPSEDEIHF
jgi:MFS family permease